MCDGGWCAAGGPFDPLGLSDGPQYETYKLKEVKNARLAMVAFLGFVSQYIATGKDPVQNLLVRFLLAFRSFLLID